MDAHSRVRYMLHKCNRARREHVASNMLFYIMRYFFEGRKSIREGVFCMKYSEHVYERPDFEKVAKSIGDVTQKLKDAATKEDFFAAVGEFDEIIREVDFQGFLAGTRYYHDASDAKMAEEFQYILTKTEEMDLSEYNNAILESPFRKDYIEKYGDFSIKKLEADNKLNAAGTEEMMREQELIVEYQRMKPNLDYEFRGEKISIGKLSVLTDSTDRETRIEARNSVNKAFVDKKDEIAKIIDELIKLRDTYAKKNGFENFLDYVNIKKGRFAYGQKDIIKYCELVKKELLPVLVAVRHKLKKELGLEEYSIYDSGIMPENKTVEIDYDYEEIYNRVQKMFDDVDPEFGNFLREMNEIGYLDLAPSPNKSSGFAFTIYDYLNKMPFIFANVESTPHSACDLAHEFGHCLQHRYSELNLGLLSLGEMTQDLMEIPSKFNELLFHNYAEQFFGDKADCYKEQHLITFLSEIVLFCMYAEAENYLYTHVDASYEERVAAIEKIKEEYNEGYDVKVSQHSKDGVWLLDNMLVLTMPGYAVSYSFGNLASVHLASIYNSNKEEGLALYKKVCSLGGSRDYFSGMELVGMIPAFDEAAVKAVREYFIKALKVEA